MTTPIDIFRAEANGAILWIGAAKSVAEAKAHVQSQPATSSGEYLLFNQINGQHSHLEAQWCERTGEGAETNAMSEMASKFPEWPAPPQQAVLEFDPAKFREEIRRWRP